MILIHLKNKQQYVFSILLFIGWFLTSFLFISSNHLVEILFSCALLFFLVFVYLKTYLYFKLKIIRIYSWKKHSLKRITSEIVWGVLSGIFFAIVFVWFISLFISVDLWTNPNIYLFVLAFVFWTQLVNFCCELWSINLQKKELKNRIKAGNIEQTKRQKEILQDLISPHFLFNSLNTIVSIIPENKDNALRFVKELSELYSFMLENSQKTSLSISEDLILAKNYVYLLKTRLESSINVDFDIPNEFLNCHLPPFTLQNLIENAVKHNSVSKKNNLNIYVYCQDNFLVVKNNLNPKMETPENSTNLGLNYIKTLLAPISEIPIQVNKTEFEFMVKIPLIYLIKEQQ